MLQCYSKSRQQVDTITDGGTVDTHAVRMEADADAEIAGDVVTMVVNTAPLVQVPTVWHPQMCVKVRMSQLHVLPVPRLQVPTVRQPLAAADGCFVVDVADKTCVLFSQLSDSETFVSGYLTLLCFDFFMKCM